MKLKTFSVSEVNEYIKKLLSFDVILNHIQVEGEISNFKLHQSGHMYFSLKDERGRIRCVMFKSNGQLLKFLPEEGMRVIIKGHISVYEKDGQYQLYVQEMEPAGIGAMYKAYEQLKRQLEEEGLFAIEEKKSLPFLPKKIGVVTSPSGAAIRDIISVINRRNPNVEILIYPVLVQGIEAGKQINNGIQYLNNNTEVDVIIIGRGGGSIEELWAFNEEIVARSIWASNIPIISAVGHETDFTISDFVADVRAATPSAAAELVVPSKTDLIYTLESIEQRMVNAITTLLANNYQKLNLIESNHVFINPLDKTNQYKQEIDNLNNNLVKEIKQLLKLEKEKIQGISKQLNGISHFSVINRGYSLVKDKTDKFIVEAAKVVEGENIQVILKDGILKCVVEDIIKGGEKNV